MTLTHEYSITCMCVNYDEYDYEIFYIESG